MAPRSKVFKKELWALLKGGLFDKALNLLRQEAKKVKRDPEFLEIINGLDENSGMAPLHIGCAAGCMEFVAELLSMDADISILGLNGNNALHFAALNERKGIIEILIRSGADLSVPNHCGLLPVDLCKSPAVADLFLRDRSNLFSPIAQTRTLLSEYIAQLGGNAVPTAALSARNEQGQCTTATANALQGLTLEAGTGDIQGRNDKIQSPQDISRMAGVFTPSDTSTEVDEYRSALDEEELSKAVLNAAMETAKAYRCPRDEFDARYAVVKSCQKLNEVSLRKLLSYDPSLSMSRITNLGNLAVDGQTPLHVAAGFNNLEAMKILLELGSDSSCWVRDMQGRCPLHVAAERGHAKMSEFLREQMKKEQQRDPVGVDAPMDLTGTTPLGWATFASKGKPKSGLEVSLFKPGDATILPKSPILDRAGTSPWKGAADWNLDSSEENIVFAFSEAKGWTPVMEDRVFVACPVDRMPSWCLFGVCDGHGGSFSSEFLAQNIPQLVAKEADLWSQRGGGATAEMLQGLLLSVCKQTEQLLRDHPRMKVEHMKSGLVTTLDSSGSTLVLTLVTPSLVLAVNVGDSRAVLAQYSAEVADGTHSRLVACDMSRDHKPNIPEEMARGRAAGAIVRPILRGGADGEQKGGDDPSSLPDDPTASYEILCPAKPNDVIRMSRSFGDFSFKANQSLSADEQAIIAVPEIMTHIREKNDSFVVLACDGIWDVMTSQEVVNFLGTHLLLGQTQSPSIVVGKERVAEACDALLQEVLARGSVDNLSVLVAVLGAPPQTSSHIITASVGTSIKAPRSQTLESTDTNDNFRRPPADLVLPTPSPVEKGDMHVQLTPSPAVDPKSVRKHLSFAD